MTIVGDPRGYVFLRKHGALMEGIQGDGLRMTQQGRIFVITFLLFQTYLTKENFNQLAEAGDAKDPGSIAVATGAMIRGAMEKWMKDVDGFATRNPNMLVVPTDLTYMQMGQLMTTYIRQEKQVAERVGWKEV